MRFLDILPKIIAQPREKQSLIIAQPREKQSLSTVSDNRSGWWPLVREPFTGAWQRNLEVEQSTAISFYAIFACTTLIASDISKLRIKLVENIDGVWTEITNPAYSPVLRKPNPTQTRVQFWENWILSKLFAGNSYILKVRYAHGPVSRLYVLNPHMVKPLVSDDGSVFYRLQRDNIAGIEDDVVVPASEIIHDRWNCIFHPLVGISPLYASSLSAIQGLRIQENSVSFFRNSSNPGGILTAPGSIPDIQAQTMKERWEENFGGENNGRVAVLGNGLSFEKLSITAVDAQLIEQLRFTGEVSCSTFHVPPYKVGIGPMPTYNNIQALNVEYYSNCLQVLIESAEICMDEGLELNVGTGTEFDIENLLRMDSVTQADVATKLTGGGILEINEARASFSRGPTIGGDAAYLQQQNYSLAALAKRDASSDPFGVRPTPTAPSAGPGEQPAPPESNPAGTPDTPNGKDIVINDIAQRQLKRLLANANNART